MPNPLAIAATSVVDDVAVAVDVSSTKTHDHPDRETGFCEQDSGQKQHQHQGYGVSPVVEAGVALIDDSNPMGA